MVYVGSYNIDHLGYFRFIWVYPGLSGFARVYIGLNGFIWIDTGLSKVGHHSCL